MSIALFAVVAVCMLSAIPAFSSMKQSKGNFVGDLYIKLASAIPAMCDDLRELEDFLLICLVKVETEAQSLVNDPPDLSELFPSFLAAEGSRKANESIGRNGAFNEAKKDAGIPKSQQPEDVKSVPMREAEYEGGHVVKDENGNIVTTREYKYKNQDGETIVIQEHSAGHSKGDQGPHFNVRPGDNTRTGSVPGTKDHYPFNK
jgi:hypothetical protein